MLPVINLFKTEADYEEALAKIDELWEAEPRSPEGKLLAKLTAWIKAYEEKHHPILPLDSIAEVS